MVFIKFGANFICMLLFHSYYFLDFCFIFHLVCNLILFCNLVQFQCLSVFSKHFVLNVLHIKFEVKLYCYPQSVLAFCAFVISQPFLFNDINPMFQGPIAPTPTVRISSHLTVILLYATMKCVDLENISSIRLRAPFKFFFFTIIITQYVITTAGQCGCIYFKSLLLSQECKSRGISDNTLGCKPFSSSPRGLCFSA